jgi:preprotein translocase subunit SecD
MSNLRWKLLTILAVTVVFGAVGVYPVLAQRAGINSPKWLMDKILKLGLDLRGGVHLVMRVETDDALRSESELEMERLRQQLATAGIATANVSVVSPTAFKVEGSRRAGYGVPQRRQRSQHQLRARHRRGRHLHLQHAPEYRALAA